jgi:hypothetical protein
MEIMLITVNTQTHLVEAAPAATMSSFRCGSRKPWLNRARALSGRFAR